MTFKAGVTFFTVLPLAAVHAPSQPHEFFSTTSSNTFTSSYRDGQCLCCWHGSMSLSSASARCLVLGGRRYYAQAAGRLPVKLTESLERFAQELIPVSLIRWSRTTFDQTELESLCLEYSLADDVWCPDFASSESALSSTPLSLS